LVTAWTGVAKSGVPRRRRRLGCRSSRAWLQPPPPCWPDEAATASRRPQTQAAGAIGHRTKPPRPGALHAAIVTAGEFESAADTSRVGAAIRSLRVWGTGDPTRSVRMGRNGECRRRCTCWNRSDPRRWPVCR
jgi:hypothetical protein